MHKLKVPSQNPETWMYQITPVEIEAEIIQIEGRNYLYYSLIV